MNSYYWYISIKEDVYSGHWRLTRKKNATDAEAVFGLPSKLSKMAIIIMEKPIPINPLIKVFLRLILSSANDGSNEANMKTI